MATWVEDMTVAMTKKAKKVLAWYLPEPGKLVLYRIWQYIYDMRLSTFGIKYISDVENIYHCTVHKAGSQWFREVLFDPLIYQWCGLKPWLRRIKGIDPRSYWDRYYERSFPRRRIVTPLYIRYEAFQKIPKPVNYRAFFVARDPRNITVSYYFSMKFTHTPMGDVPKKRAALQNMGIEEGLIWTIRYLRDYGLYDALKSWKDAEEQDTNVLVVKLEDFSGSTARESLRKLLVHCDIRLPVCKVDELLTKYGLDSMRSKDHRVVAGLSHYRSGRVDQWKEYFNTEIEHYFKNATGNLVELLGYDW